MAVTDDLTGLYNRRFFFERFEEEIARSLRHSHTIALILLDLDFFKKVNDTYGHCAGDAVLQVVGSIISNKCRKADIGARYGGEEFIILLPECDKKSAIQTAKKIRSLIKEEKITIADNQTIQVTCSMGVASFSAKELHEIGCVKATDKTDIALYKAKENGRDRIEVAWHCATLHVQILSLRVTRHSQHENQYISMLGMQSVVILLLTFTIYKNILLE